MARKKGQLTQEDIMIYEVPERGQTRYYLIERAPFEANREKRGLHRMGVPADAVFWSKEAALEEFAKWPVPEEEEAEQPAEQEAAEAEAADEDEEEAEPGE